MTPENKNMIADDSIGAPRGFSVAAGVARGLMNFAISRGAPPPELTAGSGIRPDDIEDYDARVPLSNYMALVRVAKRLCDDPALMLHYAEETDLSELSIVGLLTHASETMLAAFAQIQRYSRLVMEVDVGASDRFELVRSEGALWLVDHRRDPNAFPELTESTFARMVCGTRRFGETPFVRSVHVTHAEPGHRAAYERIFRAPVVFGSHWNAMEIDEAWLTHRVALAPRYAFGVLSNHAEALLAELESAKSVRGRVERALMPVVHTGDINMDFAASKLGVHRQTLYRKLKAEGVTFEQLLDQLRRRLALDYLRARKVSVNETAYLVGFSDPAAFSRAFKRWTGSSPRAFQSR